MLLLATTHDDCQAALEVSSSFRRLKMIFVQTIAVRTTASNDPTTAIDETVPMAANGPEPTAGRTTGVA